VFRVFLCGSIDIIYLYVCIFRFICIVFYFFPLGFRLIGLNGFLGN